MDEKSQISYFSAQLVPFCSSKDYSELFYSSLKVD